MAESFVMIQEDYKKVYKVWAEIADSEADEITDDEIICDDMYFEDSNGGCLLLFLCGFAASETTVVQSARGEYERKGRETARITELRRRIMQKQN